MNKYFPKNSRRITDTITFLLLVILFFLIALSLKNLNDYRKLKNERAKVQSDISFWKNVVVQKPDYRDAYLELAILEYKLGDKEQAKFYLDKSLILDPNFQKGREFQKIIGN